LLYFEKNDTVRQSGALADNVAYKSIRNRWYSFVKPSGALRLRVEVYSEDEEEVFGAYEVDAAPEFQCVEHHAGG